MAYFWTQQKVIRDPNDTTSLLVSKCFLPLKDLVAKSL